jgi:hypothetical protein
MAHIWLIYGSSMADHISNQRKKRSTQLGGLREKHVTIRIQLS